MLRRERSSPDSFPQSELYLVPTVLTEIIEHLPLPGIWWIKLQETRNEILVSRPDPLADRLAVVQNRNGCATQQLAP